MKKIALAVFVMCITFTSCNNGKNKTDKEQLSQTATGPKLLLKQTVLTYLENPDQLPDTTTFSYDEQNRIIRITSVSESFSSQTDSIQYDDKGRIVTMRKISDSGSPSGAQLTIKKVVYEGKKAIVHTYVSNIGSSPDLSLEPESWICEYVMDDNNRMMSEKCQGMDQITTYNYNLTGDYLIENEMADSIYANPYALAGNQFFWTLAMNTPQHGNPSWSYYKENEVMDVQPYNTAVNSSGKKYILYLILADGGGTYREDYTYSQLK